MGLWDKLFGISVTLHEAVRRNDHKALKRAARNSMSLDGYDREGYTALHYAVMGKCLQCVKILLDSGANPNIANIPKFSEDMGRHYLSSTPLWFAFDPHDEQILELLILRGADLNDMTGKRPGLPLDYFCERPLSQAIKWGNISAVRLLLTNGAIVNKSLIREAKEATQEGYLHSSPAVVDPKDRQEILAIINEVNNKIKNNDFTPLMGAAMDGHTENVNDLLAKGADVNVKDNDGFTALMYAAHSGHTETVQTLLAKGAEVNVRTNKGFTALIMAAHCGHTETVQTLLAKGADVNAKENDSFTALMRAVGKPEIVQTLLAKGADVNAKDSDGFTALMMAAGVEYAWKNHIETVQALLDKGADLNAKNNRGETALMLAIGRGHTKIVQALLDKGRGAKGDRSIFPGKGQ